MDLQQFYTQHRYSTHLVRNLSLNAPADAFDLGMGDGGLLLAAKQRWQNVNLIGADIDSDNVSSAQHSSLIDAFQFDGFNPELPEIMCNKYGNVDLLISNPPYFSKNLDNNISHILSEAGMPKSIAKSSKFIPAELVFLAQNLRLLTEQGELGIILPAGIISGERWRGLREFLFSEYSIKKIIQLPTQSFINTDAQAFILILSKNHTNNTNVSLSHIDHDKEIFVNHADAIIRADYTYYKQTINYRKTPSLSDSDFTILRGSIPHSTLKNSHKYYIHTSHLSDLAKTFDMPLSPSLNGNNTCQGDILLGRVGRRCLGRVALIKAGKVPVSDCIIIIRAKNATVRRLIWKKLKTPKAKNALYDLSLGVGAKYLTHKIVRDYIQLVN